MNEQLLPKCFLAFTNAEVFKKFRKENILLFLLLCFCNIINAQINQEINSSTSNDGRFDDYLTHQWDFNNGTLIDCIGNLIGTLKGGATIEYNSLQLNEQGQYFELPASQISISSYHEITLEIWLTPKKGANTGSYTMVCNFGDKGSNYGYNYCFIQPTSTEQKATRAGISCLYESDAWLHENEINSSSQFDDGILHQMICTINSTNFSFYIDGKLIGTSTLSENNKISNISNKYAFLGESLYAQDATWLGAIHRFNIYNKAFTESEIKELFSETSINIYNVSPRNAATSENFSDISIYAYPITSGSRIELVNGENTITSDSILERNSYSIKARFSFKNKPLGIYDALLISANDTMRLDKCFSLVLRSEALEPTDTDNDGLRNISSFGHIVWITQHKESWAYNYELDNDLDGSETQYWNDGKGLNLITEFSGIIDGQGHKIRSLQMARADEDNVALISQLSSNGVIRNLGLTSCNISGKNNVAALVGKNNGGKISNCFCNGTISGNEVVGGLVGYNSGAMSNSYNAALVTGVKNIGGLAGNSNNSNTITKSYNIGKVIGSGYNIGGIIGTHYGKITDCYNAGSVIGAGEVAGISGWNYGAISNTYNKGNINGTGIYCGALIGYQSGSITNSFWDKENSGLTSSNGGTGKTAIEMKAQSTYTNWDFTNTWEILSTLNDGYPQLTWATTTNLINSYSPERVANSGTSTITFEGINFDNKTKVYLYKSGQDTLKADTIYTSDTYCSAKFNFNNASLGSWNILVEYPDTTVTIKNGLTVEETKFGKLDIEILGPEEFRKGRATTVTVRVTNKGNTAITSPFILIAIDSKDSKFTAHSLNSTISDSIASSFNKMGLNIKGFSFLKAGNLLGHADRLCRLGIFVFPTISGYSSYDFPIEIISEEDIAISAWQQENYTVSDFLSSLKYESSSQKLKSANIDYNCVSSFGQCLSGIIGTTVLGGNQFSLFNATVSAGFYSMDQSATNLGVRPNSQMKDIGMLMWGAAGSVALTVGLATGLTPVVVAGAVISGVVMGIQCADAVNSCKPELATLFNMLARGSFDPNDKFGYRSPSGSKYFKEDKTNFTYVIEFENKETATAAAQEVFVTDTLDTKVFDIQSFKAGSIKIGSTTYEASLNARDAKWTIDMRPAMNYITYVTLKLDTATAVAKWYFKSVDPVTLDWPTDPTAGFLPPNDSTGRGQGSVSFTIDLKKGLASDISVKNKATIVFDTNAPIITPTWENTKDIIAPVSNMKQPEVVNDSIITLKWLGEDNRNGSGVYQYNVYVKKAGDTYAALLTNTSQNSIDFKFIKETQYNFYVTAKDSAGNEEIKTNVPDITFKANSFNVSISRKWDDVLVCNNIEKLFSSYQWYKNDVAITGETKQYYQEIGGLNGSYFVKVITTDGNTGISNTINVTTSAKSIKAYPNPAADNQSFRLEIKATETDLKQAKLTISTLSGQVVLQDSNLQTQMLLNGLPKGCYIINVRLTNGEQLNEKLMIN